MRRRASSRIGRADGSGTIDKRRRKRGRGGRRPAGRGERANAPTLELSIEALAAGGDGVGRSDDGRVVFVPFVTTGDRVRVRVEREHARYLNAKVVELLEAGPDRVDPACAVFGSCGGCAWQHVAYSAQLEAKAGIVADAFARIAGLSVPRPVAIEASPVEYGYRSRARVQSVGGRVGFLRRRSNSLCETSHCPVLAAPLQAELARLAREAPPMNGEWELVCGETESRVAMSGVADSRRVGWELPGARFEISHGVFAQSNSHLFGALVRSVEAAAGSGELVFDLFSGAGFFTLGLARRFGRVLALESNPAAVADLERNLARAELTNVEVVSGRLEEALRRGRFDLQRPDAVVLDPPRSGLPPGSCEELAALGPDRIVYLSCDPATQARDVGVLTRSGYALERVTAFDLFPQTPHVESLALLLRDGFG